MADQDPLEALIEKSRRLLISGGAEILQWDHASTPDYWKGDAYSWADLVIPVHPIKVQPERGYCSYSYAYRYFIIAENMRGLDHWKELHQACIEAGPMASVTYLSALWDELAGEIETRAGRVERALREIRDVLLVPLVLHATSQPEAIKVARILYDRIVGGTDGTGVPDDLSALAKHDNLSALSAHGRLVLAVQNGLSYFTEINVRKEDYSRSGILLSNLCRVEILLQYYRVGEIPPFMIPLPPYASPGQKEVAERYPWYGGMIMDGRVDYVEEKPTVPDSFCREEGVWAYDDERISWLETGAKLAEVICEMRYRPAFPEYLKEMNAPQLWAHFKRYFDFKRGRDATMKQEIGRSLRGEPRKPTNKQLLSKRVDRLLACMQHMGLLQ